MERYNKNMYVVLAGMFLASSVFGMEDTNPKSQKLVANSNAFATAPSKVPINQGSRFTLQTHRIDTIAQGNQPLQQEIVNAAESATIVVDPRVVEYAARFLCHKREHGSQCEKNLYQNMNLPTFFCRLLEKRPLAYYGLNGGMYQYMLRDGRVTQKHPSSEKDIGSDDNPDLLGEDLSLAERKISSFVGISSMTHFINDGDRENVGIVNYYDRPYEKTARFVGLVGPCLETRDYFDWQEMVLTNDSIDKKHYGMGSDDPDLVNLFLTTVYKGIEFVSYQKAAEDIAQDGKRFVKLIPTERATKCKNRDLNGKEYYFDELVYKMRLKLTLNQFFLNMNEDLKKMDKIGYIRVVGLGLGPWSVDIRQLNWMVQAYIELLESLNADDLSEVSDIDFCWFDVPKFNIYVDEDLKTKIIKIGDEKGITIRFTQNNPATKLIGYDEDKFLIATYSWDGYAYPGNEYWIGGRALACSGDPAAACCSTITEVQNILINDQYLPENITKYLNSMIAQMVLERPELKELFDAVNKARPDRVPEKTIATEKPNLTTSVPEQEKQEEKKLDSVKSTGESDKGSKPTKLVLDLDSWFRKAHAQTNSAQTPAPQIKPDPKNTTIQSWCKKNKWIIGGIGVTLAAVLYYFFQDRISAHWPAKLSFNK